jgi:hypothetical protein
LKDIGVKAVLMEMTHPGVALLADPLFGFAVKRVKKVVLLFCKSKFPLSAAGEERVTKRSDGRVSRFTTSRSAPAE